jgi:predicted alpha/beta-hydrolase family hydrolase
MNGPSGTRASDRVIPTPIGPARVVTRWPRRSTVRLVLGHGAGRGFDAPDLAAIAATLPGRGVETVLVEQPWRVQGGRVAPAPPRLDLAWLAVFEALAADDPPSVPLVVGGRSAGARVACRTARQVGAVAVVALAFPLHPPGRPDRSRLDELLAAGVPTWVVQGERDTFGSPAEFPPGVRVRPVPFADHGFAVPASAPITRSEALQRVVDHVGAALTELRRSS